MCSESIALFTAACETAETKKKKEKEKEKILMQTKQTQDETTRKLSDYIQHV